MLAPATALGSLPVNLSERLRRRNKCAPPWWVPVGGGLLAGTAAFINALLLISAFHVPVSHMTGAATMLGLDLAAGETAHLARILLILFCFLVGATASGALIGGVTLRLGRRYGIALMIEGLVLALAFWRLGSGDSLGLGLASAACGLQNGMASSYYGLTLRTTHVTGVVTDLGMLLGLRLRRHPVPWWKIRLLFVLLGSYLLGAWLGALSHGWLGEGSLLLAAAGLFVTGLAYFIWRIRYLERASRLLGRRSG
jgi:uncharacterized membrane protein YoaK (UPF0700 family)